MKKLFFLTDYKNRFGSKHQDSPYRSGMDKEMLKSHLEGYNINVAFVPFARVDEYKEQFRDGIVLYTSSEDLGEHYKSYIEDIVYGLELSGVHVIPKFKFLRAHNNKVFMEILSDVLSLSSIRNVSSKRYGTYEELSKHDKISDSAHVLKKASGSSSTGVFLTDDLEELKKKSKQISRTRYLKYELWDTGRKFKHINYKKDSIHRNKFVVQDFIPNLKNDWKIYIFGENYYIFYRPILGKNNFRASGGGYGNYLYGSKAPRPEGIFDYAKSIFDKLDIPHASIDIAFDGEKYYCLEFQALYFGTAGILFSDCYYKCNNNYNIWEGIPNTKKIEEAFAESIIWYLNRLK